MHVRRLLALTLFALFAPAGVAACSAKGAGTTSECTTSGCTVTFDRGMHAKASLLGVDAELVAVNDNTVTIKVAGQDVDVPIGETRSAEGLNVSVQEVTDEKVVIRLDSGVNGENPS